MDFKSFRPVFLLLVAGICLQGCTAVHAPAPQSTTALNPPIDLFSRGLETPKPIWTIGLSDPTAEFLPFSKGVEKTADGVLLRIADASAKTTEEPNGRYIGLGPFPVKPSTRYRFTLDSNQLYNQAIRFWAIFRKGRTEGIAPLSPLGSIVDSGYRSFSQPFITPADVDNMIVWMRIEPLKGTRLKSGTVALLSHARIEQVGPVRPSTQARPFYGKNLLAVSDFQAQPPGRPDMQALRLVNNAKWKKGPYAATIVQSADGQKSLRVSWKPGLYPYVFFKSAPAPFYGNSAKFTLRIRGRGTIKLGLWWTRKHLPYFYQHEQAYRLTDQWQEISISSGCAEPLTQGAACSISCVGKQPVEFEISNVSLKIQEPDGGAAGGKP